MRQRVPQPLVGAVSDLALGVVGLRCVKLHLEPLALGCDPASVDPLVLRIAKPVVLAVYHPELVCLKSLLDISISNQVVRILETECVAYRVVDLSRHPTSRPTGFVLDFLPTLSLHPFPPPYPH